ncbi:hypothetical protein T4B_6700 [Trichinella pseudospiralis]|uniref:Uncharacterized protein n=1 Tax=Trichinella pseudospiralis TaxID=6337 RepID=A0A0V1GL17_TRIPS|nr:hypothetical protein T4B_6700 [Trichinella pseudospiralis]
MSTFEKPMKLFLENFEFFENGEIFYRVSAQTAK